MICIVLDLRLNAEGDGIMKCSNCGGEMREGYLFSTKDGAFSFANEVPGAFTNARKADGFVQITSLEAGKRVKLHGFICEDCRQLQIDY